MSGPISKLQQENQFPRAAADRGKVDVAGSPGPENQLHGISGGEQERSEEGDGRQVPGAEDVFLPFLLRKEGDERLGRCAWGKGCRFDDPVRGISGGGHQDFGRLARAPLSAGGNEVEAAHPPCEDGSGFLDRPDAMGAQRTGGIDALRHRLSMTDEP